MAFSTTWSCFDGFSRCFEAKCAEAPCLTKAYSATDQPAWPDEAEKIGNRTRLLSNASTDCPETDLVSMASLPDMDALDKEIDTIEDAGTSTADSASCDLSESPHADESRGPQQELRIRMCSWNLNGRCIDEKDDVDRWLEAESADVIVVGIQELIELNPRSIVQSGSGNRIRREVLEERLETVLQRRGCFRKLCSHGMVGLAILVYVREEFVPIATVTKTLSVKTGFRGIVGNKGAVCANVRIGDLETCFVNVHLASGLGQVAKRDGMLREILVQTDALQDEWDQGDLHQFTAILGDFNSRLDLGPEVELKKGSEGANTVGCQLTEAQLEDWLQKDEMACGRFESLEGFQEGSVAFPPTFGYVPGSSDLGRRYHPAWCDRVAFSSGSRVEACLEDYRAFMDVVHTSDHRPVAARCKVSLPSSTAH